MGKVIVPPLHLNGTSQEVLVQQAQVVANAVSATLSTLKEAVPHPRDYPWPGPVSYERARADWEEDARLLRALEAKWRAKVARLMWDEEPSEPVCETCGGSGRAEIITRRGSTATDPGYKEIDCPDCCGADPNED